MTYEPQSVALMVTAACQLKCHECGVRPWMDADRKYNLSIDQLQRFIDASAASGYRYKETKLSGGEPFLWPHLIKGLKLIRESGIFEKVIVFSNALFIRPATQPLVSMAFDMIDVLRLSVYGERNAENIEYTRMLKPARMRLDTRNSTEFYPNVAGMGRELASKNTMPAQCDCRMYTVIGDKVWLCAALPVMIAGGLEIEGRIQTDVSPGYKDRLDASLLENMDVCARCISNMKARPHWERVKSQT